MATEIWVNIGSGNGLLPDGTKPLPEPMLTDYQWGSETFILWQFHKRCLNQQSQKFLWKLLIWNTLIFPRGQWVNSESLQLMKYTSAQSSNELQRPANMAGYLDSSPNNDCQGDITFWLQIDWYHCLHNWLVWLYFVDSYFLFNSLRPRQNGRHFPDDIFKCIFLNESIWILIEISLKFVPKGPINNIPALVQIMAWHRPGDKPLSEPILVCLLTHICVTRPQWVN